MFGNRIASLALAAGLAVSLAGCYQPVGPGPYYGGVAPVGGYYGGVAVGGPVYTGGYYGGYRTAYVRPAYYGGAYRHGYYGGHGVYARGGAYRRGYHGGYHGGAVIRR